MVNTKVTFNELLSAFEETVTLFTTTLGSKVVIVSVITRFSMVFKTGDAGSNSRARI
jgi:hypothetical protein